MKLHLPKALLIAVLTTCVSQTTWANDVATVADSTVKEVTGGGITFSGNDDVNFLIPVNAGQTYFSISGTQTFGGNIQIGDVADSADDNKGLVINDGNSDTTMVFTGTVTGSGIIKRTGNPSTNNSAITFSGDMTAYKGNIYLGAGTSATFTFTLGGNTDAVAASTNNSSTNGVAGTGNITIATAKNKLVFNYLKSDKNVYITNTISEANGVTGSTVTLKGGADYIFSKNVTVDNVNLDAGSLSLQNCSNGAANVQSAINVAGGAKLIANGNDKLGWGTSATKSITLAGESTDKKAIFELGGRQTLTTELHMDGNAEVTAYQNQNLTTNDQAGLNAYRKNGAIIDVTGTNNEIAAALHTRDSFHITVAKDGDLLVSGQVRAVGDTINGYETSKNPNGYEVGSIVKLGEGKITFSNASNEFTKKYFQEAGETVISAAAKFQNGVKVSGGSFTLDADVTLGKAIELAGGSLNLGDSNVIFLSSLNNFSYQHIALGLEKNENGFATHAKEYSVVTGVNSNNMSGSATIKLNADDAGQLLTSTGTYIVADANATTYVVNSGSVSTSSNDVAGATGFMVFSHEGQAAGNLVIDGNVGNLTAAQILTGTTGDGNITVNDNITLSSGATSQATGKLTINGATLKMGDDKAHTFDLSSFTSVDLNNATIKYHGANTTLKNVTVGATGANLSFQDMKGDYGACDVMTLAGTTKLNGLLTVKSTEWKYNVNIETLTGSGNLNIDSSTIRDNAAVVQVALDNYTGSINVTKHTGAATLQVNAATDQTVKDVTLKNGASLEVFNINQSDGTRETTIQNLKIDGSGIVGTVRHEDCYQGVINIDNLSQTGTAAELTLRNGSKIANYTIFNLKGGSLSGVLNLQGNAESGANRNMQVNIASSDVVKNAVVTFLDAANTDDAAVNHIALGVGVDGAKVAGLDGSTTNAATIKSSETGKTRSLEIITAKDANYSTNANVESSVNLVKSGEGKQTISGTVASGSVKVNAGELALTGVDTLSLNQLSLFDATNATGGTLSVGSANGGTVNIVSAGDKVGSVIVGKDSVLYGNLTLGAGTVLTLNGYGDDAATINGTLSLGSDMQLNGVEQLLNDLAAQEAGANGLKSLKLFNVVSVDFGDVEATLAMAADALEEEQPLIAGYDASKYFSSLDVGAYALIFQHSALYLQTTAPIPEPTTATLSLLALTALAARRRRK